ncbi:hypothetical protein E1091_00130 [Micromonospora fluostatini]|uniref:Uncharacterized protein n=1 Tax=Micromonospora fluostatini TaxID=1629071 RepID=A0ABY2DS34_9ACTN|nr:hypothetical protein E1091_00130 [Micromonospora fluostatini]
MAADQARAGEPAKRKAWVRYFANHPEVVASWGEQNDRWPNCSCPKCDPEGLLPRPNIMA